MRLPRCTNNAGNVSHHRSVSQPPLLANDREIQPGQNTYHCKKLKQGGKHMVVLRQIPDPAGCCGEADQGDRCLRNEQDGASRPIGLTVATLFVANLFGFDYGELARREICWQPASWALDLLSIVIRIATLACPRVTWCCHRWFFPVFPIVDLRSIAFHMNLVS